MRPSFYETALEIVKALAKRSTCSQRAMVGAILYDDLHRIVAEGYNGTARGLPHCDDNACVTDKDGHCIMTIHAEENALLQCAATGIATAGLSIFVTHSPCVKCTIRLIQAGIKRVTYVNKYGTIKDHDTALRLFKTANIPVEQYIEQELDPDNYIHRLAISILTEETNE